jgi:hypothetical protein
VCEAEGDICESGVGPRLAAIAAALDYGDICTLPVEVIEERKEVGSGHNLVFKVVFSLRLADPEAVHTPERRQDRRSQKARGVPVRNIALMGGKRMAANCAIVVYNRGCRLQLKRLRGRFTVPLPIRR